jgi:hypothetical protein
VKSEHWLIAVNGESERIYVTALKQLFRLSAVEVQSFAKDPLKQVQEAEAHAKRQASKFSRAYVVFDTDNFDVGPALKLFGKLNAKANANAKKPGCRWYSVVSTPCFELWILLHLQYTDTAFSGSTPCEDLQKRFARQFQGYSKVDPKAAKELVETKLVFACENAEKLDASLSTSKSDMWKLVAALQEKAT